MNKQKIFFIISLFGILALIFITANQKPIAQGKISKIEYSQNKVTISLQNNQIIILFTNKILNLKQGQNIQVYGKSEIYKNQKQIIAEKIIRKN